MSATMSKDDAHKLIEQLPADTTWEDLMHEIYIRESIEKGMSDSQTGNITNVADIRKKYGLPE